MTDVNGPNPKDLAGRSKPDLSLCTGPMLAALAAGLTDGAAKYGLCNWRERSVEARTYIAAAMRHQAQWLDGEETALDSGVHHLDHAIATLCILRDAMACGTMIDNRAPTGPAPGASTRVFAAHQALVLGGLKQVDAWGVYCNGPTRSRSLHFPLNYPSERAALEDCAMHNTVGIDYVVRKVGS